MATCIVIVVGVASMFWTARSLKLETEEALRERQIAWYRDNDALL
jgi:hypothetical protein